MDSSKSSVSVTFAGTASGYILPPYIVYKAENMYNGWTKNGPKGARYNRSKSGWFDGRIFEDWFLFIVLPYFKKQGPKPKALIGDNLASHLSLMSLLNVKKTILNLFYYRQSPLICASRWTLHFSGHSKEVGEIH